jgi:hypothetical protein
MDKMGQMGQNKKRAGGDLRYLRNSWLIIKIRFTQPPGAGKKI